MFQEMLPFFFEGGHGEPRIEGDRILLPCDDSYGTLALKTHQFLNFCQKSFEYDAIFKCDDDTFVHVGRLLRCGFESHDYMGNRPSGRSRLWRIFPFLRLFELRYASGAAYFLSNRASQVIADTSFESGKGKDWYWGTSSLIYPEIPQNSSIEDRMVGTILQENDIYLHRDKRFSPGRRPSPFDDAGIISCHHVNPNEMYDLYKEKER